MTVSPGNAGASIAPTSIAMRTTASNTRSTASDATAATNPTRGVSRVSANARATSPARAGRTLLTIMPTAVARQSSMNGNRGATGSRITRQRIARNGKVDVATAAASTNSPRFACARPERTSAKGMSLKVHQSGPALNAKPSAPRQPIRIEFNPFPRGREDPFPRGPHLAASSPRADVPTRWRIVHACGPVERKSARDRRGSRPMNLTKDVGGGPSGRSERAGARDALPCSLHGLANTPHLLPLLPPCDDPRDEREHPDHRRGWPSSAPSPHFSPAAYCERQGRAISGRTRPSLLDVL